MINFKTKDINIVFRFTFFAVAALFLLFRNNEIAVMGIAASLIHEIGHIVAMKIFGVRLKSIEFYLLGIKIYKSETKMLPVHKELIILASGILLNMTLSVISLLSNSPLFFTFGMVNAAIGLFNLLPVKVFDGGQMKELLLENFTEDSEYSTMIKTSVEIFIYILIAAIILFLMINKNFTAAVAVLFFTVFEIFDER